MLQTTSPSLHLIEPTSAKIQIFTLGTLQVVRENMAVTESDWHTRQARQLLKILLTERPRPVSTDVLIEILWPNSTPSAAATTLRSAINALRNVLEPDRPNRAPSKYIVTQAPGYAFHLLPDIWLDVDEFERRLNQAHTLPEPGLRLHFLEAAIALYHDDYLSSDPYADWLQTERERLRERFFNALLQAADLYADAGRYADAITTCRRLLASDEVRENAYQSLMRYQAESGDSAGALLTYERCRTLLLDELGADPSPMTQQLHQRILNGEVEPRQITAGLVNITAQSSTVIDSVHVDASYQPLVLPQRTLLPVLDADYTRFFVGRQPELSQLEDRLQGALDGRGALVLLEGEAGVGKTRLAYQLLAQAADQGASVISATCQVLERELPFAPLADSLGRYLYGLPDAVVRSLPAASLAQLAQIVPSLQDRLYGVHAPVIEPTAGAEENRLRLIDAIVAFLVALAAQRPLVIFVDDLHWADPDTLAVVSRLAQRLREAPLFLLISYRREDLPDNEALAALLHGLNRSHPHAQLRLDRLSRSHVQEFVQLHVGAKVDAGSRLGAVLFETTNGNPLFVAETLRDLQERSEAAGARPLADLDGMALESLRQSMLLRRNQRVQEIILERIGRLPADAHTILNLCAVIGRDFSLDLLEKAAAHDPLYALEVLLERKFLIERPDERIDFSHEVVRQAVYDSLNILQRRRLHLAVAEALVDLHQADQMPGEVAMHYAQAPTSYRVTAAEWDVRAAEKLLRTYGFRQAIDTFERALGVMISVGDAAPAFIRRALEGLGLAYESLFDAEGVVSTYRRLQTWARKQGDRSLLVATYSRLTTMLGLFGQQSESNVQLRELLRALAAGSDAAHPPHVLVDLLGRRELIYSRDDDNEAVAEWQPYVPAPRPVADPVGDLLKILEPVHAVPPLFDYGWTLLVQGQLGESTRVLEAVVDLATETNQPSIASAAYHQLAVTARILGENEQSQMLNDASVAINRARPGTAAELGSMWPRIASGFLSLQDGRLDEAERRLRRVADFLSDRRSFSNYYNSANIGLGLVALARGEIEPARGLLREALTDSVHLYPYTHVHALIGLARIAHHDGDLGARDLLLRQALRFAGRRSLLEEYMAAVLEVALYHPSSAPVAALIESVMEYVQSINLDAAVQLLRGAGVAPEEPVEAETEAV